MDFFEQIGRRITNAGQGVAQQTRNLTDATRLNAKIAENKKKMSQLLFEMGQDYYRKHRKDTDNEEQEYINRVNVLFREIVRCQEEMERIKTADVCKVCGCRIAEGSSFCVGCGARLSPSEVEDSVSSDSVRSLKCPVCGSAIGEDAAFCTTCGAKLVEAEEADKHGDVQEKALPSMRMCPVCGEEAEEGDIFCLNCGAQL